MWPLVYDHHEELLSEFKKHAQLICGSPESEITPEKQKKVAKQRLSALFNAGLRAWIPEPNGEVAVQTEVTDVEPI